MEGGDKKGQELVDKEEAQGMRLLSMSRHKECDG